MDNQQKVSIKKSFLDRVYRRNSEGPLLETLQFERMSQEALSSVHCSSFISKNSQVLRGTSKPTKTVFNNRSKTPGLIKSQEFESSAKSFDIFSEFLDNLLLCENEVSEVILDSCQGISDSLSYYFTNDSDFSMNFYLSMTTILKYLQIPEDIDFEILRYKVNEALSLLPDQKTNEKTVNIKICTEKLNLKVINTLKRVLCLNEDLINLFNAFLVIFADADKHSVKIPLKKLQGEKVLEIMQKHLQTPGKMIQMCRKFPEFVKSNQVYLENIRFAEGLLFKITKKILISLDPLGGVTIFYEFLQKCVQFFYENSRPMSQISLMRNSSQELLQKAENTEKLDEKYLKLDEALELTKELLAQPSMTSTPLKGRKSSLFSNMMETKLKDFLKLNLRADISSEDKRFVLYELFERFALSEIREKALLTAAECYKPMPSSISNI